MEACGDMEVWRDHGRSLPIRLCGSGRLLGDIQRRGKGLVRAAGFGAMELVGVGVSGVTVEV